MKLPPDTIIDPRKVTHYLLVPLAKSDKSRWLARGGYTEANPDRLLDDLRRQILPLEATPSRATPFGESFETPRRPARANRSSTRRPHGVAKACLVRALPFRYLNAVFESAEMKLELYKDAVMSADLPEYGLRKGDVVKLVDDLTAADGSRGYAVEVFDVFGNTIDVHFIPADTVEPLRQDEVFCVRPREQAAA